MLACGVFAQNAFDKVSWFSGCWIGDVEDAKYEECWTSPLGNFMQGSGRIFKGDKILMREHMTIEKEGDDLVAYILGYGEKLTPEKQGTIGFKLVKSSKNEAVFENPKHDYPQRIVYSKNGKNGLIARIELLDGKNQMFFKLMRPKTK
jgi:Domain of unknown function (DUF6265)